MSSLVHVNPFDYFVDANGTSLDAGYVYIGDPNKDPRQFPIAIYYDNGLTIPAQQPLRTSNGYIVRSGQPTYLFFAEGNYSVMVLDKNQNQVFYVADVLLTGNFSPAGKGDVEKVVASIAALRLLSKQQWSFAYVTSYYGDGKGGGGHYRFDPADTTSVDNGGTVIVAVDGGRWKLIHPGIINVQQFGAKADGATNDLAAFQSAAAAGVPVIDARGLTCLVDGTVSPVSGQTWLLAGATLKFTGANKILFSCVTISDFALVGPFTVLGDGPSSGTSIGIYVADCSRWRVDEPTVRNVSGWGIQLYPGSSTTTRSDHGTVNNPRIDNCYIGYQDYGGTGDEYCIINNPFVTRCTIAGFITAAGNTLVVGGNIVDNIQDGVVLNNGANHGHGGFIGTQINHNPRYNVWASQVTNGHSFVGCHIYANDAAGHGAIFLDRSKGIYFDGGHLDCWVYNDKGGSSGLNIIRNMYCPGGYGAVTPAVGPNPGQDQLVFINCTGPGAYYLGSTINAVSTASAQAKRAIGGTALVTSGSLFTVTWPTTVKDKRVGFNGTSYTVPVGEAGIYRISANIIGGGTAMSAVNSYMELRKNANPLQLVSPTIYTTTKLQFSLSTEVELTDGDSVYFVGVLTGTSPVIGDGTYECSFSVDRIA